MIGYMGRRLILNRGFLVSCACIVLARATQAAYMIYETGLPIQRSSLFVTLHNEYVGMFIVAPCLICSLHSIAGLVSHEKVATRFKTSDDFILYCTNLLIVTAILCSAWMSLAAAIPLTIAGGSAEVTTGELLLFMESSVLQAVFTITCSCLFLMLTVLSGNGAVASIGVFLYASVDMIIAGIPQVAGGFPALSWAIVQIANPYAVVPLMARAVFPLLLSALFCAVTVLAYRKSKIMDGGGTHHDP